MFKRILTFIMLIVMVLSIGSIGMVCLAENTGLVQRNLVLNGDMEWLGTSYKIWSGTHAPETEIVHGGDKSMRLEIKEERAMYTQTINGIEPGQEYTLSFWVYLETDDLGEYTHADGTPQGANVNVNITGGGSVSVRNVVPATKTWTNYTATYTAPSGSTGAAEIQIRPQGTGIIYYDDVSFTGLVSAETAATLDATVESYQEGYDIGQSLYDEFVDYTDSAELESNAKNLIKNGGFETISYSTGTSASNWSCSTYLKDKINNYPGCTAADYEVVKRDNSTSKNGNYSMKVHRPDGYPTGLNDPYAKQIVTSGVSNCGEAFVGGAEYLLSAWVKTEITDVGTGAYFKIECKSETGGNGTTTAEYQSLDERFTDGEWHHIKYVFTIPAGTQSLNILARTSGRGTVWYDDITLGRSSSNNYFEFNTKHTFYYTDETEIEAWTDFKTNIFSIASGSKVKFSLLDENETLISSSAPDTAAHNSWTFNSSLLANKQTPYVLKAEYILANGTVLDSHSKRIYLYDRPKTMDEQGNIYEYDFETGTKGEIIPPFFMYGAKYANLGNLAEAGLEVIRINDMSLNIDDMKLKLDDAYAKDMKVLVALYSNVVIGHPTQIEGTRRVVNAFRNHPAVAAWMLMDEPSLRITTLGIRTYEEMLYYLEEGYKTVRDIDPIHPVFNLEAENGPFADSYERTSQMCDIFAIDPYPSSLEASIGGSLSRSTTRAINAVYTERPVWVLGLAANWSGQYGAPVTSSMLRYQLYDALWTGAKGAGHYLQDDSKYTDPTFTETYLATFKQAEASGEIDEIFDHYSLGNSTTWAEGSGNGYEWQSWQKDNGDIYLAVRSRLSNSGTALDEVTASFELVSSDGENSIDGYDATLVGGISEPTVTSLTNDFSCTITKGEVSLYKIKAKTGYTLSNLETSSNDTSVTVEYDVAKHLTEENGTVIYAFYDAQGRFMTMKKEDAAFNGETTHITRTFNEKIDFTSMKVFIWNSVTGMTPLSNMIEFK